MDKKFIFMSHELITGSLLKASDLKPRDDVPLKLSSEEGEKLNELPSWTDKLVTKSAITEE